MIWTNFDRNQHIHIAALQVEVIPHDGAEQTHFLETTLPAEGRDLLAVGLDGPFLQRLHRMRKGFG
jgi:hypothetical protein